MSLITRYLEAVATGNGRFQSQADSDRLANHALDYLYAGDTDNADKVRALMLPVRTVCKNDRCNTVVRVSLDAERYLFDFDDDFRADGWEQYDTDQDAWYFGVWVNKQKLQVLTYAEGDVTLVLCPDAICFNAEIRYATEFYGDGFIAKAIDERGHCTTYVQDRQRFYVQA